MATVRNTIFAPRLGRRWLRAPAFLTSPQPCDTLGSALSASSGSAQGRDDGAVRLWLFGNQLLASGFQPPLSAAHGCHKRVSSITSPFETQLLPSSSSGTQPKA